MLGCERESLREIGVEIGGALAGNAVQQVERDVVKSGITESMERAPDVIRAGTALQDVEQPRLEALRAERDARHTGLAQESRELRRHRLGVGLDGDFTRRW